MRYIACILAGLVLAAALTALPACVWDPRGSGVSVSKPLKPAECPEGYQWDEKTKRCQKAKAAPKPGAD
jgi:hypothetical protein